MSDVKSVALLGVSGVAFVGLTFLGSQLAFSSAPEKPRVESCTPTTVAAGQQLPASMVTVNVFNASKVSGLADKIGKALQSRGFLGGDVGNNPTSLKVDAVTIVTSTPTDPAVRLVAAQFTNKVTYVSPPKTMPQGVSVILGQRYTKLKKGATTEIGQVDKDTTVCIPNDTTKGD